MTIRSDEAAAMLADVDSVVAKVKQSRLYRTSALIMILWGAVNVARDVLIALAPTWFGPRWFFIDAIGVVGTFALLRWVVEPGARFPLRTLAAFCLFYAFGWIWANFLGGFGPREQMAFCRPCSCLAMRSQVYGSGLRFRRSASGSRLSFSLDTSGQARRFRCGSRRSQAAD